MSSQRDKSGRMDGNKDGDSAGDESEEEVEGTQVRGNVGDLSDNDKDAMPFAPTKLQKEGPSSRGR